MSIPVKVTDASVRECVLYANLHLRGEDTNQIGTPMTVEISGAFDRWLAEHDAKVRAEEREKAAQIAEDAPGTEASGYYACDHQSGYQEAQNYIAAQIRAQEKEQGS